MRGYFIVREIILVWKPFQILENGEVFQKNIFNQNKRNISVKDFVGKL